MLLPTTRPTKGIERQGRTLQQATYHITGTTSSAILHGLVVGVSAAAAFAGFRWRRCCSEFRSGSIVSEWWHALCVGTVVVLRCVRVVVRAFAKLFVVF